MTGREGRLLALHAQLGEALVKMMVEEGVFIHPFEQHAMDAGFFIQDVRGGVLKKVADDMTASEAVKKSLEITWGSRC